MIRIATTQKPLSLGSVGYENATNEKGERLIWLDRWALDHLRYLRGPGEEFQRRHFAAGARLAALALEAEGDN